MSSTPTGRKIILRVLEESVRFEGFSWVRTSEDLVEWDAPFELRKLTVGFSRAPSVGVVQDLDMCTFHFLNLTADVPDASWTTGDYAQVESAWTAFWTTIKDDYPTDISLTEYHWRADGPEFRPFGTDLSPTLRLTSLSAPGTASSSTPLPPQCALSVTEVTSSTYMVSGVGVPGHAPGTGRTQIRNRWGRFYLPPPGANRLTAGRWSTAECTSTSAAVKTMYDALIGADLIPVVYSPTLGKAFSIDAVHVDDIVDVVRSRRYVTPITRAVSDLADIT